MENSLKTAVSLLKKGQAPNNREILNEISSVGFKELTEFLKEKYLREYISVGGSKIKFLTGKPGSGKTHFIQMLSLAAVELGFITVGFSARDIWIHDFKDIYIEIIKGCDFQKILTRCAYQIIGEMGYDSTSIGEGMSFADYLSELGELHAVNKMEIRNLLRDMFLKNPMIDNNFAIACSLLTGNILGHPALENASKELLFQWLTGSKDVKLGALRSLGLSPAKITKYNARHMLRSLTEVLRLAAYPGLLVTIDDTDILIESGAFDGIRYTKLKREDAYESIRELIDDIDTLKNIMFVYSFDKKLIDDTLNGLKSYLALWMRIQNEIVSDKFNMFTDVIDLDKYAEGVLTKEAAALMSRRLAEVVNRFDNSAVQITEDTAAEIISRMHLTKLALPRQIVLETLNPNTEIYE